MVLYLFWYSNDNCVNFFSSTTIQRNGGVDSIKVKRAQTEIDRNSIFIRILTSLKAITWYHLKHSTMFASRSHTHKHTHSCVRDKKSHFYSTKHVCASSHQRDGCGKKKKKMKFRFKKHKNIQIIQFKYKTGDSNTI